MLLSAKIQVVGDAKLKRACMAAQDVDVAAVHSKTLPFLLSAPGKTVAVRQVRASVLERVPTAWVGQVALGFLRLRSGQALRLRAPSAVSCDESVRRFAQDDDFVGVLKKRSRRLALMGRQSWVGIEKRNESRRDD
jgi:hypothetical protein